MHFVLTTFVVALLATFAMASAPQKSVIMSWPNDTPDSVVEAAKKAIIDAKGTITHEYSECSLREQDSCSAVADRYDRYYQGLRMYGPRVGF